ncbi:MAG: class I SAM-dependent methyltransferase [Solirubrobacteraceae bacterium]
MDDRLMKLMLDLDERHWWYRGRRRIIRAELDRLAPAAGARVLDAGCGSGRTLAQLETYGEVCGIELNDDAAAVARARGHGEVRVGRLESLPWPDGTFDLITCLDVIEHTPEDRTTLRELRRVCRPGGRLLLTVPAYQFLWSAHDEANHHYRRYSHGTLGRACADTGWHLKRMTSFNSLLLPVAATVRLAQRCRPSVEGERGSDLRLGPRWLNSVLERPLQLEARWLSGGRTLPAGLSLLAVVENPRGVS